MASVLAAMVVAGACSAGPSVRSGGPAGQDKADPSLLRAARLEASGSLSLILRESAPSTTQAEDLVRDLGGRVTHQLSVIGGFSASVPAGSLFDLLASPAVVRAWADGKVSVDSVDMNKYDTWVPNLVWKAETKLPQAWLSQSGAGVGVALLDTGVSPVADLAGRIVATADFTSEGDGLDRYGHGTHLAGIIAGNGSASSGLYGGVAPKANIISVKVAGADGSTDVSVVIAGLQWVIAHRTAYNIRILNLSFGTDSAQPYGIDPLNYAVEQAWFSGILVVVSAGNRGPAPGTVNKPADDPYVVTVGAANLRNTLSRSDDIVESFSSMGPTQDGLAKPDLVAPGTSIVSTLAPGSSIATEHPEAVVSSKYIKGTGTSQATAIVSGVAALMFQGAPSLTPDVAKAALTGSAHKAITDLVGSGAGLVDAYAATSAARLGTYASKPANQGLIPSTGLGSLEASRGSLHVYVDLDGDGVPELLTGETGFGWGDAGSWSASSWSASSWGASSWGASSWSAGSWSASSWSASSWGAGSWSASSWSAGSWSAGSWSTSSWSAGSWSAGSWS